MFRHAQCGISLRGQHDASPMEARQLCATSMRIGTQSHLVYDLHTAGFHETPAAEAMFRRFLPMKDVIALEDWNRFAAMFDIDGMSWSDRCAPTKIAGGMFF